MNKNSILLAGFFLAIAVAAVLVLALTGRVGETPERLKSTSTQAQPSAPTEPSVQYAPLGGDSTAGATDATPSSSLPGTDIFNDGKEPASPKEAAIEQIVQGKVTYSAEGVPVIQPFLNNPDEEIRLEAIEAMKQLDAPEAAAALREAAKTARNANERAAMLEAAEFVELPSILDLRQQQQ